VSALDDDLRDLREQLGNGSIQKAYTAIIAWMSRLRTDFAKDRGEWTVSGLYQGQFDMTYFALSPPALKSRDLKLAVVFDYSSFRFEVWLSARNRTVQRRYWKLLRSSGWSWCRLVEPAVGVDAIVVCDVADGLELGDPAALAATVAAAVARLLGELEGFLGIHDPRAVQRGMKQNG
jgi:hypothetical protein